MHIKIYDKKGELKANRNGEPQLIHAVDAQNAVKSGIYRAEYEDVKIGDQVKRMIVSIHEKTVADKKKEAAAKRKAMTAQAKALEAEEKAINEEAAEEKKDEKK